MTGRTEPAGARVAYLASQYPALSHTFIATEVAALRGLGAEVHTFSIRPSDPAELLTDVARQEHASTEVLQRSPMRTVPRALLALLRRSPRALLIGLATAARSGPRTLRARTWQLFYLVEAIVLWWRMSTVGLRHLHVHFANNGADVARLAVTVGRAVDGPAAGWSWSIAMHGSSEFEDRVQHDLAAKFAAADAVACISDYTRSQVMRDLAPAQWPKVGLVRMGVDTCRFRPADVPADRRAGAPLRILTVGRLVPVKGIPLLVDAVAALNAQGTPAELTIVGGGPLREELTAGIAARGLEDVVHLLGPVSQEHLPELYRQADVFCLPSFNEGIPVVLMEAMATGLPVVTTAITGIPELVQHRRTGLLVTPGRADQLADALAELAADPALVRELGTHARAAVVRDHDPEANGRRLLALLDLPAPALLRATEVASAR